MFHPPNQHLNGGTTKRRNTLHEIVLARKSVQDVGEGVLRTLSMPAKPTFYDHVLHEALQNRMQELTAIAEHPSPFCSPCFADFQIDFMRLRSPDRGRNISADSTMSIPAQTSGAALIRFEPSSGYESDAADTPISGVFLKDLLAFKNCLQFPGETVLQNGYKLMRLALVAPNYPIVVKGIARNCEHRSVTRFNLAFSIAHHYWLHFKRNPPKDLGAVVDFDRLQLISVYTADQEMWVAQLAFVPPVRRWSMY